MRVLVFATTLLLWTGSAEAQGHTIEASDGRETARAYYEEGIIALGELRFSQARDAFESALNLYPTIGVAFNLGLALRGTGEFIAAVGVWEQLLEGTFGELDSERRLQVDQLVTELRSGFASARVHLLGAASATVLVDGGERGLVGPSGVRVLALDPGVHHLSARAERHRFETQEIRFALGERREVFLRAEPIADESLFESPLFWILSGVAVVLGLGTAVFVATGPHELAPVDEPPFGIAVTLTIP